MSGAKVRGFSKFLETSQGIEAPNDPWAKVISQPAPLGLLSLLARGPSSVPSLLEQTRSDFLQLASALRTLQETGLVSLEGSGSQEKVSLTDMGRRLLSNAP